VSTINRVLREFTQDGDGKSSKERVAREISESNGGVIKTGV
jgi:hypothetical protein